MPSTSSQPSVAARVAVFVAALVVVALVVVDVATDPSGGHRPRSVPSRSIAAARPAAMHVPAPTKTATADRDDRWTADESAGGTRPDASH